MRTEFDQAVRHALGDIIAASPTPESEPIAKRSLDREPRWSGRTLAVAASVVLIAGAVGLIGVAELRSSNEPARSSSSPVPTESAPAAPNGTPTVPPPTESIPDTPLLEQDDAAADPDSPVGATGQRIGETPTDEAPTWTGNGEIDPDKLPAWATVASAGRIIGYVQPIEVLLGDADQVTIYGENGQPIGAFIDGKPVVDAKEPGE